MVRPKTWKGRTLLGLALWTKERQDEKSVVGWGGGEDWRAIKEMTVLCAEPPRGQKRPQVGAVKTGFSSLAEFEQDGSKGRAS